MEQKYYIQSGSVDNATMWWKDKLKGETIDLREAGVFTEEEAIEICKFKKNKAFEVELINETKKGQKLIFQRIYLTGLKQISPFNLAIL